MKRTSPKSITSKGAAFEQVIVETPRGSHNKYKFDQQTGRMKLSKVMPEGMMFPYDFGFLPGTKGEDGDPIDVLILNDEATFPACQIDCRLIGVIKANQTEQGKEKRNDRLIAVAQASVLYAGVEELSDLEAAVLKQIEDFFVNYQKVREIDFKILAREGSRSAKAILKRASGTKVA
ncbi:MAG TPA: inorganic diphosphatase [Acidobacteriaceae bacterium]